jgi:hypothetical protein
LTELEAVVVLVAAAAPDRETTRVFRQLYVIIDLPEVSIRRRKFLLAKYFVCTAG